MGKVKPQKKEDSSKDVPKKSLKTIIKPKEKLSVAPVHQPKQQQVN